MFYVESRDSPNIPADAEDDAGDVAKSSQNVFAFSGRQLARRDSSCLTARVRITESAMKMAATTNMYPLANSPSPQWMAEFRFKPTCARLGVLLALVGEAPDCKLIFAARAMFEAFVGTQGKALLLTTIE